MIGVTRRDADCLIRDVSTTNGTDFTDLYGAHLTSVVAASLCLGAAAVLPRTGFKNDGESRGELF